VDWLSELHHVSLQLCELISSMMEESSQSESFSMLFSLFDPVKVLLELHEDSLHLYCTRLEHADRGCFSSLNV
jgi:hypothetical protein